MISICTAPQNDQSRNDELERLISATAEGDKNSFSALYKETSASLYNFILSILRNRSDAEDILHELYIKVYASASLYTANGKPMAWLFTIARNLSMSKLRERKRYGDPEEQPEPVDDFAEERLTDRMLLDAALKMMTEEEYRVITLRAVAGMKHHEISALLDIPLTTELSKYHRALKKLKSIIGEDG